jgi:hypothetical protein
MNVLPLSIVLYLRYEPLENRFLTKYLKFVPHLIVAFFYLLGEIFLHDLFMDCPFPCRHLHEEGTLLGKIMYFFTN